MRIATVIAGLVALGVSGDRSRAQSAADTLPWNVVAGRLGSARLGFALLYDVDAYRQSEVNRTQVGSLATIGTVRTRRLIVDGTLGSAHSWRYLLAVESNRLENIDPPAFTLKDLAVSVPAGRNVWISVGRSPRRAPRPSMSKCSYSADPSRSSPSCCRRSSRARRTERSTSSDGMPAPAGDRPAMREPTTENRDRWAASTWDDAAWFAKWPRESRALT